MKSFDRYVAAMEKLDRRDDLTPEEELRKLLEHLVAEYDDRLEIPQATPHEVLVYQMEKRELRQADLLPVIGTRAEVSDIVTGKRGISKSQAKKLAGFFKVGVEVFI
jgi:HTH-type transcriptional regulator/antitoxin HigA